MSAEGKENAVDTDALKRELKSWESAFKEKNGRKPGRADIKSDATIAAKYKLYDRKTRRDDTAPKQTPRKSTRPRPREDGNGDGTRHQVSATPRRSPSDRQAPLQPPIVSPTQEVEATPAHIKCALGPTPLKDGQVLGIFDVPSATPLRGHNTTKVATETLIAGTPSKSAPAISDAPFSKTPQSAGRRFFLDAFAGTPLKRKREEGDIGTTSSSKRKYATPAFLRRSFPLASIDEEGAETAAARPPFRKRGLVRSLSSIIQNLRNQEEERMDEEWDIMNEIEEEEEANEGDKPKKKTPPKVLVEDSQAAEMPLGPDEAPLSDESSGEDAEKSRKPWKKKGLKRQTKRVKMKPVLHKAKKAEELEPWDEESESEIVPETQQKDDVEAGPASESEEEDKPDKRKQPAKKSTAKEDEKSKSKPRKVNPDAHANFRKLKIKNKNSKANGRGRKFGRR